LNEKNIHLKALSRTKILILGGSHRDIPLIQASQALGYYVITLGAIKTYLGHNYSDKKFLVDFSDLDAVKQIIENEQIDYILAGCSEAAYISSVTLSNELGIGCYDLLETAQLLHNKWAFKKFCLENQISTPNAQHYTPQLDLTGVSFPLAIKPTTLSGGQGVSVVNSTSELRKAVVESKKFSTDLILEEYIEGQLIAYSLFLQDQKVIYGFVGDDKSYLNKYLINTAYPTILKEVVLDKMKNDVEKIASQLQLVDGMFHLQIIIKDDIPYIIDVTRRIPGDLYPKLIEYCDGVSYSKAVVKAYLGEALENEFERNLDLNSKQQKFVIRHCVMAASNGTIKDVKVDHILHEKICYRLDLIEAGQIVNNFMIDVIAIIFIESDGRDEKVINNINSLIFPVIETKVEL